jgi:Family of unknown function (DUF6497)
MMGAKVRQNAKSQGNLSVLQRLLAVSFGLLGLVQPAFAQDTAFVDVPSGQPVTLIDVVLDEPGPAGNTMRFRFLAPEIAPDASIAFDIAVIDMAALCDSYALPRANEATPVPDQIVISLADRIVPFGQTDPDATQYFEAYRIVDGACVWDMF